MREPGAHIKCKAKCCKSKTRCKRCPVVVPKRAIKSARGRA